VAERCQGGGKGCALNRTHRKWPTRRKSEISGIHQIPTKMQTKIVTGSLGCSEGKERVLLT
jgi:hypothetical protein